MNKEIITHSSNVLEALEKYKNILQNYVITQESKNYSNYTEMLINSIANDFIEKEKIEIEE